MHMRSNIPDTIMKTLLTARFIDGFWDRWLVHGVEKKDLIQVRRNLTNSDKWVELWYQLAEEKIRIANEYSETNNPKLAEHMYRVAGLYFNLIHWIFPEKGWKKEKWLQESLQVVKKADKLSSIETSYVSFKIDGQFCKGRMRVPEKPLGCIIIINPLDSAKEELFTYEMDFINGGFATVSFDGPGQGETFVMHGLRATTDRWIKFLNRLIDFADSTFPELSVHLFGTSSGAAWAIYGSSHANIKNSVAVSPAFQVRKESLPDYFVERVAAVAESEFLPTVELFAPNSKVLLFHGNNDLMVSTENIYQLKERIKAKLIQYTDEGHCCNFKLQEIRALSMKWFMDNKGLN